MSKIHNGITLPILPGMEALFQQALPQQKRLHQYELAYTSSATQKDQFMLRMCECCNFTSSWQMPLVSPVYERQILKLEIMGYNRLSNTRIQNCGTHFYSNDYKIMPSLRDPLRVYERIKRQPFIIGPDYSVRMNMPFPQKLANSFNIKLVTAWYQYMGIMTVPNIVWAEEEHIMAYLDGYPSGSIVAINSTGIGRDSRSIANWQMGYEYVIECLKPVAIIRYGVKLPNEIESISYYKMNDNAKSCNYGW